MPRARVSQAPADEGERITKWMAARDLRWAAMLFNAAHIMRGAIRDPGVRVRHSVYEANRLMAELKKPCTPDGWPTNEPEAAP
jgi:hypothetical protein